MTTSTISYTGELITTACWCGIHLAIPARLYNVAHETGRDIYCPLGHQFTWGDTEFKRAQRELERARNRAEATSALLLAEERSHAATRGHLTRQKKRAAAAVCPCCNRSFVQLRRHMESKHPNYKP